MAKLKVVVVAAEDQCKEPEDSDNDGYDDLTKVINGTDPNDPTDYPGGGWGW